MNITKISTIFFLLSLSAFADIKVGSTVNEPTLKNHESKQIDINEFYKKGKVLIYFFPKADTPGCTAQACSLRDGYDKIQKAGVSVFGVSTDSPEQLSKFKAKYRIPFQFISDEKEELAKIFVVPVRLGFASRQAFLLENHKIIWMDRSASTDQQASDVLTFLKIQ